LRFGGFFGGIKEREDEKGAELKNLDFKKRKQFIL